MGELLAFNEGKLFFSSSLPYKVRLLMQDAINHYGETSRAEASIREALAEVPDSLEVLVALYKFYFYKKRLVEAESIVYLTLRKAAEQSGFSADWRILTSADADWNRSEGPQRVFLFTLKALAFIRLRLSDYAECRQILDKIQELDRDDLIGSSVISNLAEEVSYG